LLDESGSIGSTNYDLAKSFLSHLVGRLDVDSGNTRVAVVTFSSVVRSYFYLNAYSTVASIQAAILSLTYRGGSTNTAAALTYAHTTILNRLRGDRSDVANVVIVLTDGFSDNAVRTQVRKMH